MFRALLKKELRQLLAWAVSVFAVELAFVALQLAWAPPDEMVWAFDAPLFSEGAANLRSGLLLLWALLFGNAAFAREHDERTWELLFHLPIPRRRLFAAKLLVGGGLLSLVVVIGELLRWIVQIPNTTSFGGHTFRLDWALISAGCGVAMAWIAIGYGVFLSLFRRMGVLIVLLGVMFLQWLEKVRPSTRLLDPLELLHLDFQGSKATVPWSAYAGHLLVAACAAALGGFVWIGRTERFTAGLTRVLLSPAMKWLFGIGLLGALGLFGGYAVRDASAVKFGTLGELDAPEAHIETLHYRFTYRQPLAERVGRLAASADSLYLELARRVATPAAADPILVNLLKGSKVHAGSATWNAIRMDLGEAYADDNLRRTLAHETTHVLALRASDRRLDAYANTFRFFDEGLAESLALRMQPHAAAEHGLWLEAVLSRSRSRWDFATLIDFRALTRRFGERIAYPLGFTWVQALTTACGDDAPARILAVLARPDLPLHLSGGSLFQHTLQGARCDLDQVIAEWGRELDHWNERLAGEVAAIPFLNGGVARDEDDELVMRAEVKGPALEGAAYRLNVRSQLDSAIEDQVSVSAELQPDGSLSFWIPDDQSVQDILHYQFEIVWLYEGAPVHYADEWQQTQVPK